MKVVFMGTPDFAIPSLKALCEAGYDVSAVFTQTDKPKGRGKVLTPSPVKEYALQAGLPVYQPVSLKKELDTYLPVLESIAPDFIVVVAYGKILPPQVLGVPKFGCINVHGSLLPKYRGAAPIQWTVLNGDRVGGVTTMLMAQGLDTGDMLLSEEVEVGKNETSSELYERLSFVGAKLLIKTLEKLQAGELTPIKQDDGKATTAPMLSKDMCPIDFTMDAMSVHNKIRGLSDWPCASCMADGKKLKVYRSEVVSEHGCKGKPGEVINPADFTVACGDGAIRFTQVQAEGSKKMPAADYLRGHKLAKGTVLC